MTLTFQTEKETNMNAYRKLTLAALAATALAVLTPNARAQMLEERERVTFSGPVEVPGKVLPAGTYIFEALENGHLTRPERVEAWFFPGDSTGNEFIYQKARSSKDLASITGAFIRDTGRAAADTAKGIEISSKFVGVHTEHVAVNSGVAIAHALKYL